ncbi:iron ABC transporter ATP-binding protein [Methylophaga sp. 42_25_T18]|nr:iron ABC transporter ATP-binding protein [Methylophaga sp. 42_25_T18]OUR88792.1 iron ABC transporter ATP-binding protein [Methylophaga sp. 42_8_T64]
MSTQLSVSEVKIRYRDNDVINNISFQVEAGHIACLLGPSGCGKTTLLRAIAGFEPIVSGEIVLGKRKVAAVDFAMPPQQRRVGMVFQDFALYPHLTVEQNVGFGLHDMPADERALRIEELLNLVKLQAVRKSYPHEISGGQQQRVALIRAMAPRPDILLLDEPFSSMDVELRQSLALELRNILKQDDATAILVTHDQSEAFAMADEIGVINQGQLAQWGTAHDLYFKPQDPFVAKFIGQSVLLPATPNGTEQIDTALGPVLPDYISGSKGLLQVQLRPSDVAFDANSEIKATVVRRLFLGAEYLYTLQLADGQKILCLASSDVSHEEGDTVGVRISAQCAPTFASTQ